MSFRPVDNKPIGFAHCPHRSRGADRGAIFARAGRAITDPVRIAEFFTVAAQAAPAHDSTDALVAWPNQGRSAHLEQLAAQLALVAIRFPTDAADSDVSE